MNRIPRVLLHGLHFVTGESQLPAEAGHHLCRVLRMNAGDRVDLMDGVGHTAEAQLLTSTKQPLVHIGRVQFTAEVKPLLTACLPVIRPERASAAVEKLCELGVSAIQLFHSVHTGNRRKAPEMARLQRIAKAACEQSGNPWLPEVLPPVELHELLARPETLLLGDADASQEKSPLSALPGETGTADALSAFALLVGPEGGFHPDEIDLIDAKGPIRIALGPWILRAETALPALAAVANAAFGRLRATS